jgi:hypothetical protein
MDSPSPRRGSETSFEKLTQPNGQIIAVADYDRAKVLLELKNSAAVAFEDLPSIRAFFISELRTHPRGGRWGRSPESRLKPVFAGS